MADLQAIEERLQRIERLLLILVECATEGDEEDDAPASLDG